MKYKKELTDKSRESIVYPYTVLSAILEDEELIDQTGPLYTRLNNKVDKVSGKGLSTYDYTANDKTKLFSIEEGAEVNQNTFSTVLVAGQPSVAATSTVDNLTLIAGSNVTITTNSLNKTISIAAGSGSGQALGVSTTDLGDYFISEEVEGTLQELGEKVSNTEMILNNKASTGKAIAMAIVFG
jgi:hypothetical protein